MSAPRVVAATFHTYRPVAGRKVLQIVFEVPLEKDAETLAALGYPNAAEPNWYAIARLQEKPTLVAKSADKPKRPSAERSLAERCAILCNDVRFREWLGHTCGHRFIIAEEADIAIKHQLGIDSKTELNEGSPNFNAEAAANFKLLVMTYESHQLDNKYADINR